MFKIIIYAVISALCIIAFVASDFQNIYSIVLGIINIALLISEMQNKSGKKSNNNDTNKK